MIISHNLATKSAIQSLVSPNFSFSNWLGDYLMNDINYVVMQASFLGLLFHVMVLGLFKRREFCMRNNNFRRIIQILLYLLSIAFWLGLHGTIHLKEWLLHLGIFSVKKIFHFSIRELHCISHYKNTYSSLVENKVQ